ncbi:hypothetical protein K1719_031153 [Acacia pycnantha]|nr:hypothetical protein K1719_031153 [Acacia pycnantha]
MPCLSSFFCCPCFFSCFVSHFVIRSVIRQLVLFRSISSSLRCPLPGSVYQISAPSTLVAELSTDTIKRYMFEPHISPSVQGFS